MIPRRRAVFVVAALCALTSCRMTEPASSPTPTASRPSASAAAGLTRPGAARRAVDALVAAAAGLPVIKVDVTATTATLSARKDGRIVAWQWADGVVTPVESDVQDIQQATFDPGAYALDDLAGIFRQAARISGSSSNQELQIVEYDRGQVLMTVTTRPESMPVFFRPDASPVHRLDFPSVAAFTEAIRDTTTPGTRVLAMGWDEQSGFWTDTPGSAAGVVRRVTRQAKVPAWAAERKASSSGPTFAPSVVDPAVVARLVAGLPQTLGTPGVPVTVTVQRIDQMAVPVMQFDVGGQRVVTTLSGTDITAVTGG